uniref:Non-specific lipid-transfer protein n=1 Tax=Kalanchoe fedtschenkoi TaxID=63787 RepID=A0A7N0VHE9_KALFE
MASSKNKAVTVAMLFVLVVSGHRTTDAVSCAPVVTSLTPCIAYLLTGGALSVPCCAGISRIANVASSSTSSGRQATCECIKKALDSIPGLQPGRVPPLPNKCGVKLPFPVTLNMDCSKVV